MVHSLQRYMFLFARLKGFHLSSGTHQRIKAQLQRDCVVDFYFYPVLFKCITVIKHSVIAL